MPRPPALQIFLGDLNRADLRIERLFVDIGLHLIHRLNTFSLGACWVHSILSFCSAVSSSRCMKCISAIAKMVAPTIARATRT